MRFSLKSIADELKDLEELTIQCMKCGLCQAVCPLYEKDLTETSVSRGKISLIELLFKGKLNESDNIFKHVDYCILCGRCMRSCPSGVRTDEIFLRAKHTLRKINKLPAWQKTTLKLFMEHPELVAEVEPLVSMGVSIASQSAGKHLRNLRFPISRNMAPIKPVSFTTTYGGLNKAKNERMRVIFYPGCAISYMYTNWGVAVVETLKHLGISVYVPKVNRCCGIPAATMGDIELYRKMVSENIKWFNSVKDASYVVTACPTCQYALEDLGERITGMKSNIPIMDILVFLGEVLDFKTTPVDTKTTLHIPCHWDHSKDSMLVDFIKENVSLDFAPLENQNCCGFGGTFSLKYYTDSLEVGRGKVEEIKERGCKVLLSPCPGCVMQLTDITTRAECGVDVKHPIELIYESIKGDKI